MTPTRRRVSGQSLAEYALPAVCLLVVAGVVITSVDINKNLSSFFMKASGNDKSALQGGTFKAPSMGSGASGKTGDGSQGFDNFGRLVNGTGGTIQVGGQSYTYSGPISRASRPQGLGGNGDQLYDVQGKNPMYGMAAKLAKSGAPQEYVSRVLQMAMTTEQAGNAKLSGNASQISALTASQRAQMGSLNTYAMANLGDVKSHGGLTGLAQVNGAGKASIDTGAQLQEFFGRMAQDDTMGPRVMALENAIKNLQQAAGKSDIDVNSPEMKAALAGSGLSESQLGALTQLLAGMGVQNPASVITGQAADGSDSLMAKDKTMAYINSNFTDFTKQDATAKYQTLIDATGGGN